MIYYSAAALETATLRTGTAAALRTNAERRFARPAPNIGVLKCTQAAAPIAARSTCRSHEPPVLALDSGSGVFYEPRRRPDIRVRAALDRHGLESRRPLEFSRGRGHRRE